MLIERYLERDLFRKEQYGFRRRRGSLNALDKMCGIAELCRKGGLVCVLVALDIKNTFNTLSWRRIRAEVREQEAGMGSQGVGLRPMELIFSYSRIATGRCL